MISALRPLQTSLLAFAILLHTACTAEEVGSPDAATTQSESSRPAQSTASRALTKIKRVLSHKLTWALTATALSHTAMSFTASDDAATSTPLLKKSAHTLASFLRLLSFAWSASEWYHLNISDEKGTTPFVLSDDGIALGEGSEYANAANNPHSCFQSSNSIRATCILIHQTMIFPSTITTITIPESGKANLKAIALAYNTNNPLCFITTKGHTKKMYPLGNLCRILDIARTQEGYSVQIESISRVLISAVATKKLPHTAEFVINDYLHLSRECVTQQTEELATTIEQNLREKERVLTDQGESALAELRGVDSVRDLRRFVSDFSIVTDEDVEKIIQAETLIEFIKTILPLIEKAFDRSLYSQEKHREAAPVDTASPRTTPKRLLTTAEEFIEAAKQLPLSAEAQNEVNRQVGRLSSFAADAEVYRNSLSTLLSLPWGKFSPENTNLISVAAALDASHNGLSEVKDAVLEYLSLRLMRGNGKSPIICLIGPPGVGKTSIAQSIAKALNKPFQKISLGGVRDESDIRGTRKTYVGALPGRFIEALRRAESNDPVILLDELDKMGEGKREGNAQSALLEVLDPEQNKEFLDHYLAIPYDLSHVFFVATANSYEGIPQALADRLFFIDVPSYTTAEKLVIARKHLIPQALRNAGLDDGGLTFDDELILTLIEHYTAESGVRELTRLIDRLCAKYARAYLTSPEEARVHLTFTPHNIETYLGPERIKPEGRPTEKPRVGVVTGMYANSIGGGPLPIEAKLFPGKPFSLTLTGNLGETMRESAHIALGYVRVNAEKYGIDPQLFKTHSLHIHVPRGGIRKEGPSAGGALTTALISAYTGRAVAGTYVMTGEIDLQGNILPIGGVREKLFGAAREGFTDAIVPLANKPEYDALKSRPAINVHFVGHIDEILALVLAPKPEALRLSPA